MGRATRKLPLLRGRGHSAYMDVYRTFAYCKLGYFRYNRIGQVGYKPNRNIRSFAPVTLCGTYCSAWVRKVKGAQKPMKRSTQSRRAAIALAIAAFAIVFVLVLPGCGGGGGGGGTPPVGGGSLTVTGRVVDGSSLNAAVMGATVTISGRSDQTESDGRFSIGGIESGTRTVTASKTGYTTGTKSVTLSESQPDTGDVKIYSGGVGSVTVTGRIWDMWNDRAVAGATVWILSVTATSSADGTFRLVGVPTGTQTLRVTAAGFPAWYQPVTLTGTAAYVGDVFIGLSPPPED